jgi:hypothetical protein
VKGDIKRLAPSRNFRPLRCDPFVQFFDGVVASIYYGEKFGEDDLELWFVEIRPKSRTEFFRVLLNEERKLAKLFPAIFQWVSHPVFVRGSESGVDLGWDDGRSDVIRWISKSEGTYIVDVGVGHSGGEHKTSEGGETL